MARYLNLFTLSPRLYCTGSPIIIEAGALHKDTTLGDVVLQLKFSSLPNVDISALTVDITCLNAAKQVVVSNFTYQYTEISIDGDSKFFGQKTLITLPDDSIRSVKVRVTEVQFCDGSKACIDCSEWENIPSQTEISTYGTDFENYFKQKYGEKSKVIPAEYNDLWLCSCQQANKQGNTTCSFCGNTYSKLFPFDIECVQKEFKDKEEADRLDRERQAELEKIKKEEENNIRKKKRKRLASIISASLAVILLVVFVLTSFNFKPYKDITAISIGGSIHTVGLKSDGTVVAVGYNDDRCDVSEWTDIIAVEASSIHTVGLKSDGTVVAVGYNGDGQCDVSGWTEIIAIKAEQSHTVGLKSDGTVVAVGYNGIGQCDVSEWTDIIAIDASSNHTVGLKSDGTVVAVGYNGIGQCDVSEWTDIIAIDADDYHTVGLKSDGTVVVVGWNQYGQRDVSGWTDIIAIDAGGVHTVGLKSDGTVVAVGDNDYGQCDVSGWTDIIAIEADSNTVGLKSDGTVVAVGYNDYGQCDVSEWTDIIAIEAGDYHTVGLKSDGTVVAVGDNDYGQCNFGVWRGFFRGIVAFFEKYFI